MSIEPMVILEHVMDHILSFSIEGILQWLTSWHKRPLDKVRPSVTAEEIQSMNAWLSPTLGLFMIKLHSLTCGLSFCWCCLHMNLNTNIHYLKLIQSNLSYQAIVMSVRSALKGHMPLHTCGHLHYTTYLVRDCLFHQTIFPSQIPDMTRLIVYHAHKSTYVKCKYILFVVIVLYYHKLIHYTHDKWYIASQMLHYECYNQWFLKLIIWIIHHVCGYCLPVATSISGVYYMVSSAKSLSSVNSLIGRSCQLWWKNISKQRI